MDIKKEPLKEIVDVNSTVNNLLEKIADAVLIPDRANIKTLKDIRENLYDLKRANKNANYSIFPEVVEKIEKASKIISSNNTEDIAVKISERTKDHGDLSRKIKHNIDSVDSAIKLMNDVIGVIDGTKKLSEKINVPQDITTKAMSSIIFSLLAKQLKEYYTFLFPEKSKRTKQELNITPPSQKKFHKELPSGIITEKSKTNIYKIPVEINKSDQKIELTDDKTEKNERTIFNSEDKTNKTIYRIGEFPNFITKIEKETLNKGIDLVIANKEIKEPYKTEIKSYDPLLIPKKETTNNELLNKKLEKDIKRNNILENVDNKQKSVVELETVDKLDLKYRESGQIDPPNEIKVIPFDPEDPKSKEKLNIPLLENIKSKSVTPNAEESITKFNEPINKSEIKSEKENNKLLAASKLDSKKNIIPNIDIESIPKISGLLAPSLFTDDIVIIGVPEGLNAAPAESESKPKNPPIYVDVNSKPAQQDLIVFEEAILQNKIIKNTTVKIKPSNLIGQIGGLVGGIVDTVNGEPGSQQSFKESADTAGGIEIIGALFDLLFNPTQNFRYLRKFAEELISAQLEVQMSKVDVYRQNNENKKEDGVFYNNERSTGQLFNLLPEIFDRKKDRESGENNYTDETENNYRKGSMIEHKDGNADINKNLITPIENWRKDSVAEQYKIGRSYDNITNHPHNVGFLKIYTKRSMKFETSQNEIFYLPFQFEPKISGESKGASYSPVSTLARSAPAQVYKNSNERKVSIELEYLVTAPTKEMRELLFDNKSGPNIASGGNASRINNGEMGNSISSFGMKLWDEIYIYEYLIRNFRNLVLPNMGDPKYKLGPPIVQVWYGGLSDDTTASSMAEDNENNKLNQSHPTFRTNWFTLKNGQYKSYSMRSLWVCENVSFEFKGGIFNAEKRRTQNIVITVSLIEIGPSVTDNEIMIWQPITGIG